MRIRIVLLSVFLIAQTLLCQNISSTKKEDNVIYERLANATLRIECGSSIGSGFHFRSKDIIVTNCHVIEPNLKNGDAIYASTEDGEKVQLDLLSYSHPNELDFAILKSMNKISAERTVLEPKVLETIPRGTKILFAGFPHGIPDLLVQEAIVSAPISNYAFYIDGSINGGNSGGPIVDLESGKIVGIVTQRRFMGGNELDDLANKASELRTHCQQISGRGSVSIMGIDFGQFANLMAESYLLTEEVIKANANTGIGIGFKIKFLNEAYEKIINKK